MHGPKISRLRIRAYLLLAALCISGLTRGQSLQPAGFFPYTDIYLAQLGVNDGLTQGLVSAIAEDADGYLWIGTKDGINRYDGRQFVAFRMVPGDSTSLSDNRIESLLVDSRNRLWVGTHNGGLNLFDRNTETFKRFTADRSKYNSIASNQVFNILELPDGKILLGFHNNPVFQVLTPPDPDNTGSDNFKFIPIQEYAPGFATIIQQTKEDINQIVIMENGCIWYQIADRLYQITPAQLKSNEIPTEYFFPLRALELKGLEALLTNPSKTNLYIRPDNKTLKKFDTVNGQFVTALDLSETSYKVEHSVFIDQSSQLWAWQDSNKVLVVDLTNNTYKTHKLRAPQIRRNIFHHTLIVHQDRAGNIWSGTPGHGILKLNSLSYNFQYVPEEFNPEIFGIYTLRAVTKKDRALFDPGLFKTWSNYHSLLGQTGESPIVTIPRHLCLDSQGRDVAGEGEPNTLPAKLLVYDTTFPKPDTLETFPQYDESDWFGRPLFIDKDGVFWIGEQPNQSGIHLYTYDPVSKHSVRYTIPSEGRYIDYPFISDWYFDKKDFLWLATIDGVYRFHLTNHTWKRYTHNPKDPHSLSHNLTLSIIPDPENESKILWIGTEGGGLNKLYVEKDSFSHYTQNSGLPNNVVYAIQTDADGNLWLSTNQGLCRFNPNEEHTTNYTSDHGLIDNEFNRYQFSKAKDGALFFGGTSGSLFFYPDKFRTPHKTAKTVLTGIKLSNTPLSHHTISTIDSRPYILPAPISQCNKLTFSHHENMITFSYSLLDFTLPDNNRYQYRLEGFDSEWVDAGTKSEATYTNLSPGSYQFEVRGAQFDGPWSSTSAVISFRILPPWHQTLLFRISMILISVALLYGIYRYRVRQLLKFERMRNQIAQDLHDEIGSTLSSISLYSAVMQKTSKNLSSKTHALLNKIISNTSEMMESMNDMVWTIKTDNDKFEKVVNRMRAFAAGLAEAKGIHLQFKADKPSERLSLSMDQRKNIYLIFKEAVNNAVKYADTPTLEINIEIKHGSFQLMVRDYGKGFNLSQEIDNPNLLGGNGLRGMRTRSEEMGATLQINSEEGVGTTVSLTIAL